MSNRVIFTFKALDENLVKVQKKVANGFKKIAANSKKVDSSFKKTSASFANFTKTINGKIGNLVASIGLIGSIQKVISVGSKFQDSIADLEAITGATGDSLQYLKDQSSELAKASATSSSEVATAFKLIASAKSELLQDPEGLRNVAKEVLTLANTGIDVETSAKVTTQALNQMGQSADQAARFVNVLAAGSKVGASEVAETGAAILKSGAVAKSVGLNFEELNAAIQVLAKGGIKAEIAGTGLKTALLQLEKVGAKAGLDKMRPSVVGLEQALKNLNEMQLDATTIQKIFGNEAFAQGSILIENADLFANWTRKITGSNEAQRQADIRTKTFSARMRVLGTILSGKMIKLFERLEPMLTQNANKFGTWMDSLDEEKIKSFADTLKILLDAIVLIGKGLGKIIKLLDSVGTLIGETAAAIATLDFSKFEAQKKFDDTFLSANWTPGAFLARHIFEQPEQKSNPVDFSKIFAGLPANDPIKGFAETANFLSGTMQQNQMQPGGFDFIKSVTDVNVNLVAPDGTIKSVQTNQRSGNKKANIGVNVETSK